MEIKGLNWLGTEVLKFMNHQFETAYLQESHSFSTEIPNSTLVGLVSLVCVISLASLVPLQAMKTNSQKTDTLDKYMFIASMSSIASFVTTAAICRQILLQTSKSFQMN